MNSTAIKLLIEEASASTGQPDTHWEAAAVDRLYFHNPDDPETSGAVDVQRQPDGVDVHRIRLELWIPPYMVAEIVALVTGAAPSVLAKLAKMGQIGCKEVLPLESRRMVTSRPSELPPVALGYVEPSPPPANEVTAAEPEEKEPERVKLPITKEVLADELRRIELIKLVKEQEEDERREEEQEAREEAEGEPEELDVESLAL